MARRISTSQFRSKLKQAQSKIRQAQQKQRQAISRYNQAVRNYNRDLNTAVNRYNQQVRPHNAMVRSNRQRIQTELRRLESQSRSSQRVPLTASTVALHETYRRFEEHVHTRGVSDSQADLLSLAERETANSLATTNDLVEEGTEESIETEDQQLNVTSDLGAVLGAISFDLQSRWEGAMFSLNPRNPDAARHFCTSSREIFVSLLDMYAPDAQVLEMNPDCDMTDQNRPTRRAKIQHVLAMSGNNMEPLEEFVQEDINNVMELFGAFNKGTHGPAGRIRIPGLNRLKRRVEDGIAFLARVLQ